MVGSTNLGGGDFGYSINLDGSLDKEYPKTLTKKVLAMRNSAEAVHVIILTEINPTWAKELQTWLGACVPDTEVTEWHGRMRGWKVFHDEHDVALLWGPEVYATRLPEWIMVYDEDMLAEALRDRQIAREKLNWRKITYAAFSLWDRASGILRSRRAYCGRR